MAYFQSISPVAGDGRALVRPRIGAAARTDMAALPSGLRIACPLVAFLVAILQPTPAFALLEFLDPIKSISDFVQGLIVDSIFVPMCQGLWDTTVTVLGVLNTNSVLTSSFDALLGGDGLPGIKDLLENLSNVGVKPIAATFFALAILSQFMKIAQRMDQNQTIPALKEVVTLFVFCVIYMYLIRNGFKIMGDVFNLFHDKLSISQAMETAKPTDLQLSEALKGATIGTAVVWLIGLLAGLVCTTFVYIKANMAAWGLAIQIYFMAAFAPLAFAFLAYEGTKQWALGYIRNFLSLTLTMTIVLVLLYCFPLIFNSVVNYNEISVASILIIPKLLAVNMLLIKSLDSAGHWAQGVFGG